MAGILERAGCILVAGSRYPNHADVLWNLPGGRQRPGELFQSALRREFLEETGLEVAVEGLRYVSESYDVATNTHFVGVVFGVSAQGEPRASARDAHVVDCAWVARADLSDRLRVRVVREPLLRHLADERERYFGFADAGITIEFADPA